VTNSTVPEESLIGGSTGQQLVIVTTGTMTLTTGRFVLSPLLPTIIEVLSVTAFEAGVAVSLLFGVTALCRYPGGRLSDQLSRKTILVGGLCAAAVGFSLLAVVGDYPTLLLAVTTLGIGVGFYTAAAIAHLSDLFVERRGQALGINNSSVYVAGVLGAVVANVVLGLSDWRAAFFPIAGLLVVLILLLHWRNRDPYVVARPEFDVGETFGRIFRSNRIRSMLVVGALFGIAWQGVVTFLPTFLQSEKSFPPTLASNLFALLFLVGIGANVVSGRLADRFEVLYVISGVTAIATAGLGVVILAEAVPVIVGGIVVMGVGLAAIWPVLQTYMMSLLPEESKGGDYGVISATYVGIASVGPGAVGFVGDRAGFTVAFASLAGCLLASLVLALWLAR